MFFKKKRDSAGGDTAAAAAATSPAMTAARSHAEIQKLLRAEIAELRSQNARLKAQIAQEGASPAGDTAALVHRHHVELTLAHQTHLIWRNGHGGALPPLDEMVGRLNASALFDAQWYLDRDPGLADSDLSPADHYVRIGSYEKRDPGPDFNTMDYYLANPDVATAGWPALLHYEMFGRTEGRARTPDS